MTLKFNEREIEVNVGVEVKVKGRVKVKGTLKVMLKLYQSSLLLYHPL